MSIDFEVYVNGTKIEEASSSRKYKNPTEIKITLNQTDYKRIEVYANYFKCSTSEAIRILLTNDYIEETLREVLCK